MSGLPPAVHQYPSCGACGCDTDHDGDRFACYDCQLSFDSNTLEAEFINPDEEPCGAACSNYYHQRSRLEPGMTFECQPCALPTSHHDGDPKDFQHWHGCKAVRIGGGDE